jgi:hypothetical protein
MKEKHAQVVDLSLDRVILQLRELLRGHVLGRATASRSGPFLNLVKTLGLLDV